MTASIELAAAFFLVSFCSDAHFSEKGQLAADQGFARAIARQWYMSIGEQLSQHTENIELPAPEPGFVRRIWRSVRKLFSSIIARIDLSQFPGSCCG